MRDDDLRTLGKAASALRFASQDPTKTDAACGELQAIAAALAGIEANYNEMLTALRFAVVPDHPIGSDAEYLRKIREKAKSILAKKGE